MPRCRSARRCFCGCRRQPSRPPARMNAVRITVLAVGIGDLLDRRRIDGGPIAAGALGDCARDRIYFAGGAVLDPPIWRVLDRGLGRRGRPHRRALRGLHHHRARRIHRRDRRYLCRSDLDHRKRRGVRLGLRRQPCDVVDLLPQGRRSRLRSRFQNPASRAGWRGLPIPICTCRSWPASSSRRWPTNWC